MPLIANDLLPPLNFSWKLRSVFKEPKDSFSFPMLNFFTLAKCILLIADSVGPLGDGEDAASVIPLVI